jgi:ATP-dependent RNA helicase RhlE
MQKFNELALIEPLLKNLADAGYEIPTPIQAQSIPSLLEGHDLLGIAQTGTGKTASFTLPMLQHLAGRNFSLNACEPRALILAPTRELASQIQMSIEKYGKGMKLKSHVIFGGVGQASQVAALRGGLDIVIATPGRLLDLMNQGHCRLGRVEIFVLDEADRMLDMGFINDIKKIVPKLPEKRQTLLFSATMPGEIANLANKLLKNPKRVEVTPQATTVEKIAQSVIFVSKADKYQLLRKLLTEETSELVLVFTRTKHGANKIVDYLSHHKIPSAAIHGNKSQSARENALENFKSGKIKVLIATDLASRGIDVQGVSHVINYDLPVEAEAYVHRIGRTARAGREGIAISFCDESERDALSRVQKLIKLKLPVESFKGVPEASVKSSEPDRPYRDPRAANNRGARKPQHKDALSQADREKRDNQKFQQDHNRSINRPQSNNAERREARFDEGRRPARSQGNTGGPENRVTTEKQKPKVGFRFRNKNDKH